MDFLQKAITWLMENLYNYMIPVCLLCVLRVVSVVPGDEVIDVMGEIGNEMPKKYKETAEGGLAMTPTAMEIANRL